MNKNIDIGIACDGLYVTVGDKTFYLDQETFTDGKALKEIIEELGYTNISFSECF